MTNKDSISRQNKEKMSWIKKWQIFVQPIIGLRMGKDELFSPEMLILVWRGKVEYEFQEKQNQGEKRNKKGKTIWQVKRKKTKQSKTKSLNNNVNAYKGNNNITCKLE